MPIFGKRATISLKNLRDAQNANREHVNKIWYLAFGLYIATAWLNCTVLQFDSYPMGNVIERVVQAAVIGLVFLSFIANSPGISRCVIVLATVLFAFIVWRVCKEGSVFWIALFAVTAAEFDYKMLSKIVISVLIAVFLVSTLPILFGAATANFRIRSDNGLVRNSLGFLHPNNLGAALALLSVAFSVLKFREFKSRYLLLYVLLGAFALFVPGSRTATVLIALTGLLWAVISVAKNRINWKICAVAAFAVFLVSLIGSLWLMFAFGELGTVGVFLNKALSSRPYLANLYYESSGITLFGNSFVDGPFVTNDGKIVEFLVDNAFDHVLLRSGLISFVLIFGMTGALYFKFILKKNDPEVIFGITLFMLYGISERAACQIEFNYLLIALAFVFEGSASLSIARTRLCSLFGKGAV